MLTVNVNNLHDETVSPGPRGLERGPDTETYLLDLHQQLREARAERDRLHEHFDQLEKQIGFYRDFEYHPDCDADWFISRTCYHIDKALHSTDRD